jgi:hypothetical protein
MSGASGINPAPPAPAAPALSPAEIADRARAQGSAAGAASSLGAATQAGQANQKASAGAMNTASSMAYGRAGVAPEPSYALKDPGTLTPQGAAYRDQIMKRLQGVDPLVQNAQATADTMTSRTNYMARMGADEGAAQARFAPGTLQYQRMMDNSMAGANSANLAGQNQVNDLARTRGAEAVSLAGGIEKDAYGNAIGERNFQVGRDDLKYQRGTDAQARQDKLGQQAIENSHWETTNTQSQAELEYLHQRDAQSRQDALDAIKRGDVDGAINAIQGAKAKNYLLSVKAQGGDVLGAINGMFDNGTLKAEYRDSTPAQDSLQGQIDFVKTIHPEWSDEQVQTEAIARMTNLDKTKQEPLGDQEQANQAQAVTEKIRLGQPLTAEDLALAKTQNLVPSVTSSGGGSNQILGGGAATYLQQHPDGNLLMDGALVKLVRGYKAGSLSLAEVSYNGTSYYIDNKGRWYAQPVVQNSRTMPPTIPNPLKGAP